MRSESNPQPTDHMKSAQDPMAMMNSINSGRTTAVTEPNGASPDELNRN